MNQDALVHRSFAIPNQLHLNIERSRAAHALSASKYGCKAISLLNVTSRLQIGTKNALLLLNDNTTAPVPKLCDPAEPNDKTTISIALPFQQNEMLVEYAEKAGITQVERVCRAFRLANYITPLMVAGQLPYDHLVFQRTDDNPGIMVTPF